MAKKFDDTFNRFDRIPACDRRTDGQTYCHGIVRAMHTRRAVKMVISVAMNSHYTVPTLRPAFPLHGRHSADPTCVAETESLQRTAAGLKVVATCVQPTPRCWSFCPLSGQLSTVARFLWQRRDRGTAYQLLFGTRRLSSPCRHLGHVAVGPDQIGLVAADNRTRANHEEVCRLLVKTRQDLSPGTEDSPVLLQLLHQLDLFSISSVTVFPVSWLVASLSSTIDCVKFPYSVLR